jgi:hypothetical protein
MTVTLASREWSVKIFFGFFWGHFRHFSVYLRLFDEAENRRTNLSGFCMIKPLSQKPLPQEPGKNG